MYIGHKSKLTIPALLLATMLYGCGDDKTSAEYIAEAKVALDSGKSGAAIVSLKNVLKAEIDNAEARFLLGSVYAQQGLWLDAEKELRKAQNLGFDESGMKLLLLKVNYRLDNLEYLTLIEDNDIYSDLSKVYLALISLKEGDLEKGKAIFDEAILTSNTKAITEFAMAWDSFLNDKYTESLGLLDNIVESSDISEDIIELRIANLTAQKKHEAAAEQLEMFLSLHPQSHLHRLQLADQYVKSRNYIKAEENADLLLTLYKNNVVLNRIKAEVKFNAKDYSAAKEFSEIALRSNNDVLSKVIAGISAYQLGQYESSYNYLTPVSSYFPDNHPVNQVIKSLSNQLSFGGVGSEQLLSDTVISLIKSGNYQQTRQELNKVPESTTLSDGVLDFRLGLLKVIEGDSSFTDDFERAISNGFDGIEPQVLLAQKHLQDKEYAKVFEIADSLILTHKTTALLLKAGVYMAKDELNEAIATYENILISEPKHTGAMFKLSEAYFKAGNTAKSIEYLEGIYSFSSANFYAVRQLFTFSLDPVNKDKLEQFFVDQVSTDKNNINKYIVLAEFYLLHKKLDQALSITSRYLLKSPGQLDISLLKIKALLSSNKIKEAKEVLVILEKTSPLNADVIRNKAIILNANGDKVAAIKSIEDFANINGDGLNDDLLLLASRLYIENMQILKAEQMLTNIKNKGSIKYMRLAGRMALLKGDNQRAIVLLGKVYQAQPIQIVALELSQALQNVSEFDEAIQLLENYIVKAEVSNLILVKYKLAELSEQRYPLKAESYYKQLLSETNNSVATLNNLAWFYYTQQRYSEAKGFASRGVEKAPELGAVHNTLGVILLELGELAEANKHLKMSVDLEPMNDKYKIWLAKGYILSGDSKLSEELRESIGFEALKPETQTLFNEVFLTDN
ncbi:PEP-CTERM system TPR-repeat protein PrsT [Colwellia sp. Arc7-635]|uniref:XrtA/PEP-CTERM system TPR-repeat protein PrsT n=1 Tax=Colwellia sp. Arc7-635 TaxID=2497879 RepID=UPI000F84F73B|nr:XrtA/PEP-CTERM system TPR-repeat protein PrsT [Colwellia sp. Arc7-635]AZQ82879.1 PEP-CTERM system TPR-repeat protein PrsT [Colwellia sp. Arc7-635]